MTVLGVLLCVRVAVWVTEVTTSISVLETSLRNENFDLVIQVKKIIRVRRVMLEE